MLVDEKKKQILIRGITDNLPRVSLTTYFWEMFEHVILRDPKDYSKPYKCITYHDQKMLINNFKTKLLEKWDPANPSAPVKQDIVPRRKASHRDQQEIDCSALFWACLFVFVVYRKFPLLTFQTFSIMFFNQSSNTNLTARNS